MKLFTEITILIIGLFLFYVGVTHIASNFPYNLIPTLIGGVIIGRFVSILKLKK